MLYSFNKFINESKEDEFRSLKKGDIILYMGARYTVKSADGYMVKLYPLRKEEGSSTKTVNANLAQYKDKGGTVIEKFKEKDED